MSLNKDFSKNFENEFLKYYSLKSNKEKILLVGHMGDRGGAEILLKNIISELIKQDVEVAVFVKKDGLIIDSYKKMAPTFIIDSDEKWKCQSSSYLNIISKVLF